MEGYGEVVEDMVEEVDVGGIIIIQLVGVEDMEEMEVMVVIINILLLAVVEDMVEMVVVE